VPNASGIEPPGKPRPWPTFRFSGRFAVWGLRRQRSSLFRTGHCVPLDPPASASADVSCGCQTISATAVPTAVWPTHYEPVLCWRSWSTQVPGVIGVVQARRPRFLMSTRGPSGTQVSPATTLPRGSWTMVAGQSCKLRSNMSRTKAKDA